MIPPPNFFAIRALAALLLAIVGLQAIPTHSIGIERHHGSAFDIFSVEVGTAPALRKANVGEAQRIDPPPPPPRAAIPVVVAAAPEPPLLRRSVGPAQIGPPLARDIASLALAPRPPPHA